MVQVPLNATVSPTLTVELLEHLHNSSQVIFSNSYGLDYVVDKSVVIL